MFDKITYRNRRGELKKLVGKGVILLWGNNQSPYNYPSNAYLPFRQDSTFLYYFGLRREGLAAIIDIDNDEDLLFGDDIDIEDIVWFGKVESVADMAAATGARYGGTMSDFHKRCAEAREHKREIHILPPYRDDIRIEIFRNLAIDFDRQKDAASLSLIKAIVKMRLTKTPEEIRQIEEVAKVGHAMHTTAMRLSQPGTSEKYVAGSIEGVARALGANVSFGTIYTQHGEIMHGMPTDAPLEKGRLVLCDAGAENDEGYSSDNTRTYPVGGKMTNKQQDIYDIVLECHDKVLTLAKPGVPYRDIHFEVCRIMTDRLKQLGLMKGDTNKAVEEGAHALFFPHGLGHNMGLDVHDMENLGQVYVGFDDEIKPNLEQFGTNALRMGRKLQEGYIVTDEPGLYFIPDLINEWKQKGLHKEYICYDKVEEYLDFGGIRIEDDILITADGCRKIGDIPLLPEEIEI